MSRRCAFSLYGLIGVALVLGSAHLSHAEPRSAVVVIDSGATDLFVESLVRTTSEAEMKKHGEKYAPGGGSSLERLASSSSFCTAFADCTSSAPA